MSSRTKPAKLLHCSAPEAGSMPLNSTVLYNIPDCSNDTLLRIEQKIIVKWDGQ